MSALPATCWNSSAPKLWPPLSCGCGARAGRPPKCCPPTCPPRRHPPRANVVSSGRRSGSASRSAALAGPRRAGCCRRSVTPGSIAKDGIGAIRVREDETFVQIAEPLAARFGAQVELDKGLVMERIEGEPDLDAPRSHPRPDARPVRNRASGAKSPPIRRSRRGWSRMRRPRPRRASTRRSRSRSTKTARVRPPSRRDRSGRTSARMRPARPA